MPPKRKPAGDIGAEAPKAKSPKPAGAAATASDEPAEAPPAPAQAAAPVDENLRRMVSVECTKVFTAGVSDFKTHLFSELTKELPSMLQQAGFIQPHHGGGPVNGLPAKPAASPAVVPAAKPAAAAAGKGPGDAVTLGAAVAAGNPKLLSPPAALQSPLAKLFGCSKDLQAKVIAALDRGDTKAVAALLAGQDMSGISGDLGGSAAVQKLGAWAQANADGASPDAAARPPYPGTPPLCLLYEDGRKDPVLLPKMFRFATLAIPGLPELRAAPRRQEVFPGANLYTDANANSDFFKLPEITSASQYRGATGELEAYALHFGYITQEVALHHRGFVDRVCFFIEGDSQGQGKHPLERVLAYDTAIRRAVHKELLPEGFLDPAYAIEQHYLSRPANADASQALEQIKEIKAQARQQQPKAKTRDAKAAQAPAPAPAVKTKPAAPANPLTEAERTVVKARKHGTQAVCQKWNSRAGWCARCNYAHVCGLCGQDSPAHAAYLCPTRTAPAPEPEREPADP